VSGNVNGGATVTVVGDGTSPPVLTVSGTLHVNGDGVQVPTCLSRTCAQTCLSTETCVAGSCVVLSVYVPPAVVGAIVASGGDPRNIGTSQVGLNSATVSGDSLTTLGAVTASQSITVVGDHPANFYLPESSSAIAGRLNLLTDGVVTVEGSAQLSVGNTVVTNNQNTGTTTYTLSLHPGADGSSPLVHHDTVSLDCNSRMDVKGSGSTTGASVGTVVVSQLVADCGGTLNVAGASVSGNVNGGATVTVVGDGTSPPVLTVSGTLHVNGDVVGTPGTSQVVVPTGATLNHDSTTRRTISGDVTVAANGTVNVRNAQFTGTVDIAGSFNVTDSSVPAPFINFLKSCVDGATIYYRVNDLKCDKPAGQTGTFVSYASAAVAQLGKCRVVLVGQNGCQLNVAATTGSGSSRRLLATDCNSFNFGSTSGTYKTCSTTSAATHLSTPSFIALLAMILVSLYFHC